MRHPLRVLTLACAFAITPACASLHIGQARFENPLAAAHTLDQRAYALLSAYAAIVEEATDIARDPAVPFAFKRVLGQAEAAATPAAETLEIAVAAYVRAVADVEASQSQTATERAAAILAAAAHRLSDAVEAARAPVSELEDLVRATRN